MKDYFRQLDINTVNLIIPGCNLSCAYCSLAKTRHLINEPNILQETFDSITNGTYLDTWKQAFSKLQSNPKNITTFEIWGQEPTLCLKYLNPVWENWYEYFSNINTIGFSTNGIANIEELANFFKTVDQYAYQPIQMKIQFSYDGDYGQSQVRGSENDDIVVNNLLKLISLLNDYDFKYVQASFNLHGVFSNNLIDNLDTFEKIDNYFTNYSNQLTKLKSHIKNRNMEFISGDLMTSNCENFTTNDGMQYLDFIKRINLLKQQKQYAVFDGWSYEDNVATMLFGQMARDMVKLIDQSPFDNLDDYIEAFAKDPQIFRDGAMCAAFIGVLRMDCNGYVYDCHASCYDNYLKKEQLDNSIMANAKYTVASKGRYFNLITATDEEIQDKIVFYRLTQHPSVFRFMFSQMLSLMYLMAIDGQIDKSYIYDFNKLKKHAFIMSRFNMCYDGLKNRNGSIFLRGPEEIRQLCTGVIDEIEKHINRKIEERKFRNGRKEYFYEQYL